MKTFLKIWLIAYVSFWVGYAVHMVGKMSGPPEPFKWTLPLQMLFVVGAPAMFGYLAGKSETK